MVVCGFASIVNCIASSPEDQTHSHDVIEILHKPDGVCNQTKLLCLKKTVGMLK